MLVNGTPFRTIWPNDDAATVSILDQTLFPHEFKTVQLETVDDAATAIADMLVRGAPLIGATAAYGIALACRTDASRSNIEAAVDTLAATRPTAINLLWALNKVSQEILQLERRERATAAWSIAARICDDDVAANSAIGTHGLAIIESIAAQKAAGESVNILTHCNAGWLATVDWGTATSPIYKAHDKGINVHVYVDETRPRNQGAHLTAWELGEHGVPHTVIVDNAGGHLMQHGHVDLVIVGSDRTTARGDVCNKIGTYLKALAANANDVPFYVTVPVSTIDFDIQDGLAEIPIEERSADEVTYVHGVTKGGDVTSVRITPAASAAANPAFDVTPNSLVTALITEKGVFEPNLAALSELNPK